MSGRVNYECKPDKVNPTHAIRTSTDRESRSRLGKLTEREPLKFVNDNQKGVPRKERLNTALRNPNKSTEKLSFDTTSFPSQHREKVQEVTTSVPSQHREKVQEVNISSAKDKSGKSEDFAERSFVRAISEAIFDETLLDSKAKDHKGPFRQQHANKSLIHAHKDSPKVIDDSKLSGINVNVNKQDHRVTVFPSIEEAFAEVGAPFVCLTDLEILKFCGWQSIDGKGYKGCRIKEMMAMKQGGKVTVSKSPMKEKVAMKDKRDEDDLSLQDLKSVISMSDKSILNSNTKKLERLAESVTQPPKRGRKPKSAELSPSRRKPVSADSSPTKAEQSDKKSGRKSRKSSPAVSVSDSNKDLPKPEKNNAISPNRNNSGKSSTSPRRQKKDKKAVNNNSGTPDSGNKKKTKTPTQSPTRKQSPKKISGKIQENNNEKVKSDGTDNGKIVERKSPKKEKAKALKSDETTEGKGKSSKFPTPKKSPEVKSPRSKNKKESDSELSPKIKKTKPKSANVSPKASGKKTPNETSSPSTGAKRALEFEEEHIKEKILQSKLNLPENFKYEYKSGASNTADLNSLIEKVNSALKDKDGKLVALFGSAEDLNASSPETGETSDSDKTLTEFVDSSKDNSITELSADVSMEVKEENEEKTEVVTKDIGDADEIQDENMFEFGTAEIAEEQHKNESPRKLNQGQKCELEADNKLNEEGDQAKSDAVSVGVIDLDEVNNEQKDANNVKDDEVKQVSIFDMFGLKLKRKSQVIDNEKIDETINEEIKNSGQEVSECNKEKVIGTESENDKLVEDTVEDVRKGGPDGDDDDDDVIIISEQSVNESIVISDDENVENNEADGSGTAMNEWATGRCKPKFTTVNNIVEPKPLDILSWPEKSVSKETAFCSEELDEYLEENKENFTSVDRSPKSEAIKAKLKGEIDKAEADIDDIGGVVFLSFENENILKAHTILEQSTDWLTDGVMKKLAQLRQMKERQMDSGIKRVTDVKSLDEQKQSFRGVPMRMVRYQKLLKLEYENILLGKLTSSVENSPSKAPQKTADITKIKGWKTKFQTAEELQEATGINISESGKVHWKTEERLLKNLDPEDVKDIGLDLKKKRRKLVSYATTNKRKCSGKLDSKDVEFEYDFDESIVTERDVFNEEDEKPLPDKIPYAVKYHSQHKYGMRKQFVKKMNLDKEDERILKKLGTQKIFLSREEEEKIASKMKKSKYVIGRLTQSMAMAALSALNKKLINKSKKSGKGVKKEVGAHDCIDGQANHEDWMPEFEKRESVETKPRTRPNSRRQSQAHDDSNTGTVVKEDVKGDVCMEPGCRYGCICHLCKLSDSGEEKEPTDNKPACDKEYCKLGCICDSIETNKSVTPHCRKQGCMFVCKCPPKQPKPDIPRDHSKKKRKGKQKKRKSPEEKPLEDETVEDKLGLEDQEETEDWEPPSKRKRGQFNSRFANLPKRESTYRLAKNLDAVSRKAMEVYATSEMYVDQKIRRRKSDPLGEDGPLVYTDVAENSYSVTTTHEPTESVPSVIPSSNTDNGGRPTGVVKPTDHQPVKCGKPAVEILESDDNDEETETCSRLTPYTGHLHIARKPSCEKERRGNCDVKLDVVNLVDSDVINLIDSDDDDLEIDINNRQSITSKRKGRKKSGDVHATLGPSTSTSTGQTADRSMTVSERIGLAHRHLQRSIDICEEEKSKLDRLNSEESNKFKTQMVCLKARKKQDEKASTSSKISLLEIISNCDWEKNRNDVLSKISHVISKDPEYGISKLVSFTSPPYKLQFLPRSNKPAVIPPELKLKLPPTIYSVRIKLTLSINQNQSLSSDVTEVIDVDDEDSKKIKIKMQKKLIDKIKFAQRLRGLIIAEAEKGVTKSQFSVSRMGIERALKKYKLQLWKSYTGSSDFDVERLKKALRDAKLKGHDPNKKTATNSDTAPHESKEPEKPSTSTSPQGISDQHKTSGIKVDLQTMTRISVNQGLNVTCSGQTATNSDAAVPEPTEVEKPGASTHSQGSLNISNQHKTTGLRMDLHTMARISTNQGLNITCGRHRGKHAQEIQTPSSAPPFSATLSTKLLTPVPLQQRIAVSLEDTLESGKCRVAITEDLPVKAAIENTASSNAIGQPSLSVALTRTLAPTVTTSSVNGSIVATAPPNSTSAAVIGAKGNGIIIMPPAMCKAVGVKTVSTTSLPSQSQQNSGSQAMATPISHNPKSLLRSPYTGQNLLLIKGENKSIALKGKMMMVDSNGRPVQTSVISPTPTILPVSLPNQTANNSSSTIPSNNLSGTMNDRLTKGKLTLSVSAPAAGETRISSPDMLNSSVRQVLPSVEDGDIDQMTVTSPSSLTITTTTLTTPPTTVAKAFILTSSSTLIPVSAVQGGPIAAKSLLPTSGLKSSSNTVTIGTAQGSAQPIASSAPLVFPIKRAWADNKTTTGSSQNMHTAPVSPQYVLIPISPKQQLLHNPTPIAQVLTTSAKRTSIVGSSLDTGRPIVTTAVIKTNNPSLANSAQNMPIGKRSAGGSESKTIPNDVIELDVNEAGDKDGGNIDDVITVEEKDLSEEDQEVERMIRQSMKSERCGKRKRESPDMADEEKLEQDVKKVIGEECMEQMEKLKIQMVEQKALVDLRSVVFKYNQDVLKEIDRVPVEHILTQAQLLIEALETRDKTLQQNLYEVQQKSEHLNEILTDLMHTFEESGLPKNVVSNFLKSVKNAMLMSKPVKHVIKSKEEGDWELDFDPVTLDDLGIIPTNMSMEMINLDPSATTSKPIDVDDIDSNQQKSQLNPSNSLIANSESNNKAGSFVVHTGDATTNQTTTYFVKNSVTKVVRKSISQPSTHNSSSEALDPVLNKNVTPTIPIEDNAVPNELNDATDSDCFVVIPETVDSEEEAEVRSSTGDFAIDHEEDFIDLNPCSNSDQSVTPISITDQSHAVISLLDT